MEEGNGDTPGLSSCLSIFYSFRHNTFESDVSKDDFIVCLGIVFSGDPFEDRCNGVLGIHGLDSVVHGRCSMAGGP